MLSLTVLSRNKINLRETISFKKSLNDFKRNQLKDSENHNLGISSSRPKFVLEREGCLECFNCW
jgi:hypothetical protein